MMEQYPASQALQSRIRDIIADELRRYHDLQQ